MIILIVKVGIDKELSSRVIIGKEERDRVEKGDYFLRSGGEKVG